MPVGFFLGGYGGEFRPSDRRGNQFLRGQFQAARQSWSIRHTGMDRFCRGGEHFGKLFQRDGTACAASVPGTQTIVSVAV